MDDLSERPGPDATVFVDIDELQAPIGIRLHGLDEEHVASLVEVIDQVPPILVHAETLRILDGAHRVEAARQAGCSHLAARLFYGSEDDGYVEAVAANVHHGKPLTRTERRQAGARLIRARPCSSDRAVAQVCGLSSRTVAELRNQIGVSEQVRIGQDGRARPLDPSLARVRVAELLTDRSDRSLRETARIASTSVATVRDVRDRLGRGEDPCPPMMRHRHPEAVPTADQQSWALARSTRRRTPDTPPATVTALRSAPTGARSGPSLLADDAAFRSTPSLEAFAGWFDAHAISPDEWRPAVTLIPISRLYEVSSAARSRAEQWRELADALEGQVRSRLRT